MTTCFSRDKAKSLMAFIESSNLKWDRIEDAKSLIDDPVSFEEFFRKHHSKRVCALAFGECSSSNLPPLLFSDQSWLSIISRWRLEEGGYSCTR